MASNEDAIFGLLRKEIDERMPLGLPETKEKTEIKILKHLFTPEEAKIAVHLSALPEPVSKIQPRLKKAGIEITDADLEKGLDKLVLKGAIMGGKLFPKPKHYSLAHLAVGMYEFQVDRQTKEFAEVAEDYMKSTFYKEFAQKDRPRQLRTIPIEKSLTPERFVSTYDDIKAIVKKAIEPIVIIDCVCKQSQDLLKNPCKLSDVRNNCVMFGNVAEYRLELGTPSAKKVTKDELLALLDKFQKIGYILQPENAQEPKFMCICCGCCCGALAGYNKFPRPADFFTSNYYAQVNLDLCKGCETCVKRCQLQAITVSDKKAKVNLDRCIGCGNCVATCSAKAMVLVKKDKETVPPKTHDDLYQKIMIKKRGALGSLKMVGKMILGKKV